MIRRVIFLALSALLFLPVSVLAEDEREVVSSLWGIDLLGRTPHYLDIGAGVFDVFKRDYTSRRSASGFVELRVGEKLYGIGPAIGLMANTDGGVNGYGAIYADLAYGQVIATPFAGLGGYVKGDSSDLGGTFQFRIGSSVAYQFENKLRLGVRVAHISNAGIHNDNPGEEEIYLTVALPF